MEKLINFLNKSITMYHAVESIEKELVEKYDLNMIYISGPGHGGNAMVAHTYMEGTYSEVYPFVSEDEEGLKK